MNAQHTPEPWRIWRDADPKEPLQIIGMETDFVCTIAMENTNARANAAFIVKACNAHADLLAALRSLLPFAQSEKLASHQSFGCFETRETAINRARAAINKMEGQP